MKTFILDHTNIQQALETRTISQPAAPRCKDCKWIHEADSNKGTSFMGVELCAKHAATPELLEALEIAKNDLEMLLNGQADNNEENTRATLDNITRAIQKASG